MGIVYRDQGNHTIAIGNFKKAIELNPDAADYYASLGAAYIFQDNNTKALHMFDKAIELDPDDAITYVLRSISKKSLGDMNGSLKDTKIAARLGNKNSQDWLKENGHDW